MALVLSRKAESDLEQIGDFIAQDNPMRAVSFVREVREHCTRIARQPGIGTSCPELGDGVLRIPHGRYLIFCRALGGALRVERILHSARDITVDDFAGD